MELAFLLFVLMGTNAELEKANAGLEQLNVEVIELALENQEMSDDIALMQADIEALKIADAKLNEEMNDSFINHATSIALNQANIAHWRNEQDEWQKRFELDFEIYKDEHGIDHIKDDPTE